MATTWVLQTDLGIFFMIKQIIYTGVLQMKIPEIYHLCPNK